MLDLSTKQIVIIRKVFKCNMIVIISDHLSLFMCFLFRIFLQKTPRIEMIEMG